MSQTPKSIVEHGSSTLFCCPCHVTRTFKIPGSIHMEYKFIGCQTINLCLSLCNLPFVISCHHSSSFVCVFAFSSSFLSLPYSCSISFHVLYSLWDLLQINDMCVLLLVLFVIIHLACMWLSSHLRCTLPHELGQS